jgi:hypothetical protein
VTRTAAGKVRTAFFQEEDKKSRSRVFISCSGYALKKGEGPAAGTPIGNWSKRQRHPSSHLELIDEGDVEPAYKTRSLRLHAHCLCIISLKCLYHRAQRPHPCGCTIYVHHTAIHRRGILGERWPENFQWRGKGGYTYTIHYSPTWPAHKRDLLILSCKRFILPASKF